jgi:iron complex outermembrane receptor protein
MDQQGCIEVTAERRSKATAAAALTLAALAGIPAARGDDSPPAVGKLAPVTVTAERREEKIQDVPISISTLGGEKLDVLNSSGQDVRFLAARVPSLNIESSFGRAFPRFYIRGLGNTDFDLNASQPVSLVYDDVVQENPILKGFPVFDLARIEVLRGPQGTLFGRNSPAGVIRFESARPVFHDEANMSASLGNYTTFNADGAYNAALSDKSALRLSMSYQHRDNWVTNSYPGPTHYLEGYEDQAARLQYLYQPDSDFSALFNAHGRNLSGSARLFRANILQKGSNELVSGFSPGTISIDGQNHQSLQSVGGNVRLQWNFAHTSLFSVTGFETVNSFSRGDVDGGYGASYLPSGYGPGFIPFSSETADGLPSHQQITQELRLQSRDAGPLEWLAGLYYFREDIGIDSYSYDSTAGGVQNGYAHEQQKSKASAAFGSLNYAVSERFKLRAGLRLSDDRKDFQAQRLVSPIGQTATGVLSASPTATDTSWDLSGTYALDTDTNLYGRVARGYRAPSVQGRLLFSVPSTDALSQAKAEHVISYETGIKTELFDRRARLSFDVFKYTVTDQQLTAVGGQSNATTLLNAAKVEGHGAELDLQAYLSDQWMLTLGGSYNHTEIRDPNLFVGSCAACTLLNSPGPSAGTVSINGNPLPQAPEWVGNFTLRYAIPTAAGEYFAYTDWAYRSKINFFLYRSTEFTGKSLFEGGLRTGYTWNSGRYEAAAFVRNLTNTIRVVGGIDFNNLTGFINEPRTFGVQFRANL